MARSEARIGALLVHDGSVTASEVRSALRLQEQSGRRLGDLLMERGAVSRLQLERVLAKQKGMQLEVERGFGTGLRAALERAQQQRPSVPA